MSFRVSPEVNANLARWHEWLRVKNAEEANLSYRVVFLPYPSLPFALARGVGHVKTRGYGDWAKNWANTVKFALGKFEVDFTGRLFACEGRLPAFDHLLRKVTSVSPDVFHKHGGRVCHVRHMDVVNVVNLVRVTRVDLIPSERFRPSVSIVKKSILELMMMINSHTRIFY